MASSTTHKISRLLATLEAMLRVVTPDHPFQPVLAASINVNTWRAVFVKQCEELQQAATETNSNDNLKKACGELHDFAAAIFGDSYFDHFDATIYPEHDALDFSPDDEFFENNRQWLNAKREALPAEDQINKRIELLDDRWKLACQSLLGCLEEGQYAAVLPAVLALNGENTQKNTVLGWLLPPAPGPDYAQRSRDNRICVEMFVRNVLLPNLQTAVDQVFPESKHRSIRQQALKRLRNAAADVLASYHLRSGWETLLSQATAVIAIRNLFANVLAASPKKSKPIQLTGLPMLDALRLIPLQILNATLRSCWDEHLKNPSQMQAVVASLHLQAHGHTYIGQNTLGKRLRAAHFDRKESGWTDKADERLRKLGGDMIAIHGSENWIPQPIPAKKSDGFRSARKGYGWLVNPLLVLWESVYKSL